MIRLFTFLFTGLFLFSVTTSCKDKFKPEDQFIKIYDDANGNTSYKPLAIEQTQDNGYIILTNINSWNIGILKIDKTGELEWKYLLPSKYVNALPTFIRQGNALYFTCMDEIGLFTYIMRIDEAQHSVSEHQQFNYILYPTAAYAKDQQIFIQNYQRYSYETGIYQINTSLTDTLRSRSLQIMTDVEEKIVDHITHQKRLPFSVHVTPEADNIVMSGFYNYSFSLVFLDNNLNFKGVYNGPGFNGGIKALLPLGSSQYSVARYSYDYLYFATRTELVPTAIDIIDNIPGEGFAEIDPSKPVLIRPAQINNKKYSLLIGTTRSNNILIQYMSPLSQRKEGSKYIGKNTPYTICDAIVTPDNGLLLLIQIKVMGIYNKVAIVKLTENDLAAGVLK